MRGRVSDDPKAADPNAEVPFHEAIPGLREGEGPAGPNQALTREQILRILGSRAKLARAALGLEENDRISAVLGDFTGAETGIVGTAAPTESSQGGLMPGLEPAAPFSSSARPEPVIAGPTLDSMEAAAEIARKLGTTVRVEMPGGRAAEWTPEQIAERRRFSEGLGPAMAAQRKAALEKFGPDIESGWDVPPPSTEKLSKLLNLHGAGAKYNLCATCKHAVQIVQPVSDLGGFGKFHGIRTFCSLIREDGGRNLEIGDEPTQYCSHYGRSWALTAKHRLLAVRTNGHGEGRVVRTLRVWFGEAEKKEEAKT